MSALKVVDSPEGWFNYSGERIPFERLPRPGTTARVLIKVLPGGRVQVLAPEDASDEEVTRALAKRARWIYTRRREFLKLQEHVKPRRYISGESHFYLGKRYLLKVMVDPDMPAAVRMFRGRLEVTVRQRKPEAVKAALDAWYRLRAREVFHARLENALPQALWVTEQPRLRVLAMKTQWGNCSANGLLTLNAALIKAPGDCIDYVIMHELCHLAEHSHSKRFYALLDATCPGWQAKKSRLDGMAEMLLA